MELIHQNELYREAEREISESESLGVYFGVIRIVNLLAKEDNFKCKVLPAFRPDKALGIELPSWRGWLTDMAKTAEKEIEKFTGYHMQCGFSTGIECGDSAACGCSIEQLRW